MTSETPDKAYSSIALIDLSAIFAQYWFGNLNKAGEQAPKLTVSDTLTAIERIDRTVGHTVLCLDAPPYLRATVYPDYKANRPAQLPEMGRAKREVLRVCEEKGYRLASADGFEGDDVIATLCAVYRLVCDDIRIIGCDKDLFQLVRDGVRVLRPAKGDQPELLLDGPAVFKKTGGITPAMIVDFMALTGDPGDNIPGCPTVGEKRATHIIGSYGTLEKLYWELEHKPVETNRFIGKAIVAKLIEHKAEVLQARELVRLRIDAPVDANELLLKRKGKPARAPNPFPGDGDNAGDAFDAAVAAMPASGWPNPSGKPEARLLDPAHAIPSGSPALANAEMAAEAVAQAAAELASEPEAKPKSEPPKSEQQRVGPSVAKARPRPVIDTKGEAVPDVSPDGAPVTNINRSSQATRSTALVPQRGADVWDLALEPKSLKEAMWLTVEYHSVGLFPRLTSPQHYLAIIMMGRSLGLDAMASLMNFEIVEGMPRPRWQLIVGFAQQHPDCEYFQLVETTVEQATYVTKRRQNTEPQELTFTMADAERTGLVKPLSGWETFPAAKLRAMCSVHLARAVYPDSRAIGLYCREELGSIGERAA